MYKTLIQIVLFLTLIFVLSFTFYKYFYIEEKKNDLVEESSKVIKQNDENLKKDKDKGKDKIKDKENKEDSIIYNLSYKKFDIQGNIYLIEALKGIIQDKKPNIIFMNEVKASITYLNNEKLLISSKNAIFNNKSFETRFFDGVELRYEDQKLTSDSLDFLFDKNIAIFKDNVRYENLNTKMFSNKITINLLTKEIEINSKNSSEKIRIEKK